MSGRERWKDALESRADFFQAISDGARQPGVINLGQSEAELGWPDDMLELAARLVRDGASNQYPPSSGVRALREGVVAHYLSHQNLEYDTEGIVVTSGATEALAAAILALVQPASEVVVFQPAYGAYVPLILRAGGRPRLVGMRPDAWVPDLKAFEKAAAAGAQIVIVNTPLNPFGTSLDGEAADEFGAICLKYGVTVISDEVWEHTQFDRPFRSIASVNGMQSRTVKIGAAGKIFGLMGWKVGWACSSRKLTHRIALMHESLTFATSPPLQHAVAFGLAKDREYFDGHRSLLYRAKERLESGLTHAGFAIEPCTATHFLIVNLAKSQIAKCDLDVCSYLLDSVGVATVPVSIFFGDDGPTEYLRLCFAKRDETIDAAIDRLAEAGNSLIEA